VMSARPHLHRFACREIAAAEVSSDASEVDLNRRRGERT
jgi:hypothetical protein